MKLLTPLDLPRFLPILYFRFAEMNQISYEKIQLERSLDEAIQQLTTGSHKYFGNFRQNRPAALLIERLTESDRYLDIPCSEIEWLVACPYSKGSGRELLQEYLQNKQTVRLDVSTANERAIQLYHDCGFEIVGTYGVKDPMHVMALRI